MLEDYSHLPNYVDSCVSFFDQGTNLASIKPFVHIPASCLVFRPQTDLSAALRQLANEVGLCLMQLFRSYERGVHLSASECVSRRVPYTNRVRLPTVVRLDVIETAEGCKVVEVNSGTCAGIEVCSRMYAFLREWVCPSAPSIPPMLTHLMKVIEHVPERRAICSYLEDGPCRYLGMLKRGLIQRYDPSIEVDVLHIADVMKHWTSGTARGLLFREFMYDDLDLTTPSGQAIENFLMTLPFNRQFPSLSDEFLSNKSYIANVDEIVRSGHGVQVGFTDCETLAWERWMAPTARLESVALNGRIDFEAPSGCVVKPSFGYGGCGIVIIPRVDKQIIHGLTNRSLSLVIQKYYPTRHYLLRAKNTFEYRTHVVHGVFLLPDADTLYYGGTFTRLSQNPIVGREADIALYCEPEWFSN